MKAALVGPEFEAVELSAAYGSGVPVDGLTVTDGRPWKYSGLVQYCPIRSEPMTVPLDAFTRLPLAWYGKISWAMPVIKPGYRKPGTMVRIRVSTTAGRRYFVKNVFISRFLSHNSGGVTTARVTLTRVFLFLFAYPRVRWSNCK